jgi:hypothetical protein
MDTLNRKIRVQLTEWEIKRLRNLLAQEYHYDRRNFLIERRRIKNGQKDNVVYSTKEQGEQLKKCRRLLKKLSKHVNERWSER